MRLDEIPLFTFAGVCLLNCVYHCSIYMKINPIKAHFSLFTEHTTPPIFPPYHINPLSSKIMVQKHAIIYKLHQMEIGVVTYTFCLYNVRVNTFFFFRL